jgi:predicted aldo/keto reductase-like oxidoreductase
VHPDAEFDPSRLSDITAQVKFRTTGDKKAEAAIRPIGVLRDRHQPLPYLAVLMELGTESHYKETNSKIKYATSEPPADGDFEDLCDAWDAAVKKLETYRKGRKPQKKTLEKLKKAANDARVAMDSCNRYSLSVRGVSEGVYGVLRSADVVKEFATLLNIIMPLPVDERSTRKHMRPLERLSATSSHTDWMLEYVVSNELGSDDDSDPDVM